MLNDHQLAQPRKAKMLSTIITPTLYDPKVSATIGQLSCHQSDAYNQAVTLLNRAISIPKRSSKKDPRGLNKPMTLWRNQETHRKTVPYSVHQTGWEQAWEANEKLRANTIARNQRIQKCLAEGKPIKKRDAKEHRRTLGIRTRKSNPALTISEGRILFAKGHTINFKHRTHGFTIKTTQQNLELLDIRTLQLVPARRYSPHTPLEKREYFAHIQVEVTGGLPSELPEITTVDQILGFDRGYKKNAAASNGKEVVYDPKPDYLERKKDWQKVTAKKKGSKRQQTARATASNNSRKRRERRKASKRHQIREIIDEQQPLAVAVEALNLPNMTASARGTVQNPGKNVKAKTGLNRTTSLATMGETNSIIRRECEKKGIPFLPVPAAGTSHTCTRCGHRTKENRERQAVFRCKQCSLIANPDFTASEITRNRAYVKYFNQDATREEAPTGWQEQPSQGTGRVPLFRDQGEIKPKGAATRPARARVRSPRPTTAQLALALVAKEDVYISES